MMNKADERFLTLMGQVKENVEVIGRGDCFTDEDGNVVPSSITAVETAKLLLEVSELLRKEDWDRVVTARDTKKPH